MFEKANLLKQHFLTKIVEQPELFEHVLSSHILFLECGICRLEG